MPLPIFATGQPLTAVDANTLARQGVITVETTPDRDALPAPHEGMTVYVETEETLYLYRGGAWRVLYAAPRPYTPTLFNITLGNGYVLSEWSQVGDYVHWWVRVTFGPTSVMTGFGQVTLPKRPWFSAIAPNDTTVVGNMIAHDVSASGADSRRLFIAASDYTVDSQRVLAFNPVDGSGPNTVPWTWDANDTMDFSGSYRVQN